MDLLSLYRLLLRNPSLGFRIKSFHLYKAETRSQGSEGVNYLIPQNVKRSSQLLTQEQKMEIYRGFIRKMMTLIYAVMGRAETVVIEDPFWGFPLVELTGVEDYPFTSPVFLTCSLKRIRINFSDEEEQHLTAKQALWILLFTQIEQAILAFQLGDEDMDYLSEHCPYLQD